MNPKFVTLVLIGLSLINTNTFTMDSQLRRPLLGPELSGQEMAVPGAIAIPDLELGGAPTGGAPTGVTPEAQPGYFKQLKDACIGGVSSLWSKLSMYLIHSSLEEYAVLTGRKNKFNEGFGELPINLQQLIIERLNKLAEQVRLIKAGKASMPVADIETGLVTPVRRLK